MNVKKLLFGPFVSGRGAVGLLAIRLVVGLALAIHGWGKIQTPFSWMGPDATTPGFLQLLAAISEFFGGMALIVGLLTPIASFGILCTMAVAVMTHMKMGQPFVDPKGGGAFELPATYLGTALLMIFTGPGALSLDAVVFKQKPSDDSVPEEQRASTSRRPLAATK